MSRLNPKPMITFSPQSAWDRSCPSLDEIPETAVSSKTLSLALEAQYAETHRLHHHLQRLVRSLPLPALLYNRKGRVVSVNHEARVLMTNVDWKKGKWQVEDLWKSLAWPSVPFSHWEWKDGRLSCWDCPLSGPDRPSSLSIRYIKYEPVSFPNYPDPHLHRLAAIGEKTGRLAHDIRNPLSSIEWFATLLGRQEHPITERRELTEHLIQAIRSLDGLVANLLLFSTPLQGQRHDVVLATLLDDVELLAMYPLRKKKLTIHRQYESHLHTITANESLLKQALLNLLLNAIHASPSNGRIDIHCRHSFGPDTKSPQASGLSGIMLTIRDEGCGMSEDELKYAFQPFFSKRKGGTGLGLPIVKDIVQLHQGMIHIISGVGKGTTVELFLPQ